MRQLLLLRHAKAESPGATRDHDRPLTERGRRDAALMGRFVTAAELVPDLVVTSTALRARATAELALHAGEWSCPLRQNADLYAVSIERALEIVGSLDRGRATVLLVGHEPTWSTLAATLAGGGRVRLPTAGLVHVAFDLSSWAEVTEGSGELRGLVTPAMLRGLGGGLSV